MKARANGIDIEYEDTGGDGPVVLLVMGLGMQLIAWSPEMVRRLAEAGYRVIRHDNRDIGLSQDFAHLRSRNLLWEGLRYRLGLPVRAPYALQDMAADALGLLDVLGIARAHVVGASMGGMIAQRMAATAPERVRSLVSIMSSSGARGLPGPHPQVAGALMRRPLGQGEAARIAQVLGVVRMIASPAYPQSDQELSDRIRHAMQRAWRPDGTVRQMLAIGADSERPGLLARIACPTLVLHGEADRLVPIACGRDTARRIPGARFVPVPGMGHDLPPPVVDLLLGHILPFLASVDTPAP